MSKTDYGVVPHMSANPVCEPVPNHAKVQSKYFNIQHLWVKRVKSEFFIGESLKLDSESGRTEGAEKSQACKIGH